MRSEMSWGVIYSGWDTKMTAKAESEHSVIEVPGLRPVIVFPREAVLEIGHVAAAFGVGKRSAERYHFKCFYLGSKTRRFLWGDILDECSRRSA